MLQAYVRGIDLNKGNFGRRSLLRREMLINALDGSERSSDGYDRMLVVSTLIAGVGIDPKKIKKVLSDFGIEQERLEMIRNIDIRGLYQASTVATEGEAHKVYEALSAAGMIGTAEEDETEDTTDPDE